MISLNIVLSAHLGERVNFFSVDLVLVSNFYKFFFEVALRFHPHTDRHILKSGAANSWNMLTLVLKSDLDRNLKSLK